MVFTLGLRHTAVVCSSRPPLVQFPQFRHRSLRSGRCRKNLPLGDLPIYLPEDSLPDAIRALGDLRGNEYAWPLNNVEHVLVAACANKLATVGGQVQVRTNDAICELYWHAADADPRTDSESWHDYVNRSTFQVAQRFRALPRPSALADEAYRSFDHLRSAFKSAADVTSSLCFVLYFDANPDALVA